MTTPYPGNSLWPGDYSASTLTGRYVGADGSSYAGRTVTFTMPGYVIVPIDDAVVVPASMTVTLDETGFFRLLLPATDDPDIQPVDWTYTVVENWEGGRTFYTTAPAGETQDVSVVAPVPQSLGTVTYMGPKGDTGDTGPIGVVWLSAWDSTESYVPQDAVSFNGTSYICLVANVGLQPDTHGVYWDILAQAGVNGLPGTANLGPVILSGTPAAGNAIIATDSTHATWAASAFPPGMVIPFAGLLSAIPAGWLPCDGSLITRTTYPALFAAIGTLYGVGDGSTTFNLPDLSASIPFGATPGQIGGSATHNHGVSELQTIGHTHGASQMKAAAHTHTVPPLAMGAHTHDLGGEGFAKITTGAVASPNFWMQRVTTGGWGANLQNGWPGGSVSSAAGITSGAGLGGVTEGLSAAANTGAGTSGSTNPPLTGNTDPTNETLTGNTDPGSTMPPYVGMVFLIKT